jgi:divalent metal cation (Fe/Co/Zn/Cd) transporter
MTKRTRNPVKERKEQTVYVLFYFFIIFGFLNTVFGLLSGSKCLFVSGIFALFGVLVSVVTLLRIGRSHPGPRSTLNFNPDKLEFIILLGSSAIIALCTAALFFVIGHMAFFDALYSPELSAAWVALVTAFCCLGFTVWVKYGITDLPEIDMHEVVFILDAYFLLSGGLCLRDLCGIFSNHV